MAKESGDFKQSMFQAGDAVLGAAVLVAIGVWLGSFLDSKLHTSPWLVVALSLLGAGLGLWRMIYKAMQMDKNGSSPDPLEQGSGSSDREQSDSPKAPPRPTPEQKPREMKDTKARSSFEFLDQGDSK